MGLEALQERFPQWEILQTPKGVWVARRRKHIVLTMGRIDQGLRDTFIEQDEETLVEMLTKQTELDATLLGNPRSK
jgi:hypothetical protein